jgi:hypothetical protein
MQNYIGWAWKDECDKVGTFNNRACIGLLPIGSLIQTVDTVGPTPPRICEWIITKFKISYTHYSSFIEVSLLRVKKRKGYPKFNISYLKPNHIVQVLYVPTE